MDDIFRGSTEVILHAPIFPVSQATQTNKQRLFPRTNLYAETVGSGDSAEIKPAEMEIGFKLFQPLVPTPLPPVSEIVLPFCRAVVVLRYEDTELLKLILSHIRCLSYTAFLSVVHFC